MKKQLLIIVVISAFSFASCKKDRVCTCVAAGVTEVTTYTKSKKAAARANCLSYTTTDSTGTYHTDCTLK
jgi:hypothetical protein